MIYKYNLLCCLMVLLVSCGSEKKVHPVIMPLTEAVYASGNIKAFNQYLVHSGVSGILKHQFVREKDLVSKGQIIAEIENDVHTFQLDGAETALLEAQKNQAPNSPVLQQINFEIETAYIKYKSDSLNKTRYAELLKEKSTSKLEYETREISFQSSKNRYAELLHKRSDLINSLESKYRSSLNAVKVSHAHRNQRLIQSSINGKVYGFYKKEGELIQLNEPLAVIGDKGKFIMELQVDELDVNKIKIGQQVLATLDTYGDKIFKARITKTAPILDKQTKTLNIEAEFIDSPENLYPGMSVEANIIINEKSKALVIPKVYLLPGDSVKNSKEGKVHVNVGLRNLQYVEILSGLDTSSVLYK